MKGKRKSQRNLAPLAAGSYPERRGSVALVGVDAPSCMGGEEFASRERNWQQKDNEAKPAQDEVELKTAGVFASQDF